MNKIKFYTVFSILNILLTIYIAGSVFGTLFLIFYNLFYTPEIIFFSGLILYIICFILKLLLPKIFVNLAYKYKDSLINKFVEFLQNNPQMEKIVLPIAFCFDLPFILYCATLYDNSSVLVWVTFSYFIIYVGGVLLFYIMLYRELKIKDGKIKPFF